MHRAGAEILGRLWSQPAPPASRISCACGHAAHDHDTRPKPLITALGPVRFERGYYVCPQCHRGQSPRDCELDVEGTECSPGVRRMLALVGAQTSFDKASDPLEWLVGLEVTTQAVERHAEAMGADIAARDEEESAREEIPITKYSILQIHTRIVELKSPLTYGIVGKRGASRCHVLVHSQYCSLPPKNGNCGVVPPSIRCRISR